jgi:hypothetical protein
MTRRLTMAQAIIQFLKSNPSHVTAGSNHSLAVAWAFLDTAMLPALGKPCSRTLISLTTCSAMSRAWFTPRPVLPR